MSELEVRPSFTPVTSIFSARERINIFPKMLNYSFKQTVNTLKEADPGSASHSYPPLNSAHHSIICHQDPGLTI